MIRTHHPRTRRFLRTLGVATASLLLLSGCAVAQGGSGGGAADGVTAGGTLRIAAAADAQPQNALAGRAGNFAWKRLVFDSLISIDPSGDVHPVLAKKWDLDEARTTLTLELRDDVTFHSGRPFTADDVVYTLEQAKDPANASQLRAAAENIEEIEKVSDTEVKLHLTQPSDSMMDLLDLTPIVDKDTWSSAAEGKTLVGTGPYTWESWTPGASITLERNADYWAADTLNFDEVEVSIISDSTAMQSAMKSGAADLAIGMAPADLLRLSDGGGFELVDSNAAVYPLGFDVAQAPFNTPEARQAIGYAIDRERIVEQVFGGDAKATDLWWTPTAEGYPKDLETHYSYDPAKAEKLLEEAGAAGASLEITYLNQPVLQNLFEVIQNNLSEVGLKVTANALDAAEFDKRQVEGTLGQSFMLFHPMIGWSPSTMLGAMPAIRPGNPSHFESSEFDALKANLAVSSPEQRSEALTNVTDYMLDQAFSQIIVSAPSYHIRADSIGDVGVGSFGCILLTDTGH